MSFEALLLDPTTKQLLSAYYEQPKHALLLTGPTGCGLGTIAHSVAALLVEHPTDILDVVPDEKGTITIELVRTLYVRTRDKRVTRQVVVIDDIDAMSFDAQNAYLKLLEEPAEHTYFIVTTHAVEALLPTITSRTQVVDVRTVGEQASNQLLKTLGIVDSTELQQMLFLAHGLPAELTRLASDKEYFEIQAAIVRTARALLNDSLYARLVSIAGFTDRTKALRLVTVLGSLVEFMLHRTPDEPKLLSAAKVVEQTAERLEANGHVRTQLMNLVSQLR